MFQANDAAYNRRDPDVPIAITQESERRNDPQFTGELGYPHARRFVSSETTLDWCLFGYIRIVARQQRIEFPSGMDAAGVETLLPSKIQTAPASRSRSQTSGPATATDITSVFGMTSGCTIVSTCYS